MDNVNTLREYGLFDAKVPRYTSYPPANRFQTDVGARWQRDWLTGLKPDAPISVYIHIPFCRRLCWFCACRTLGTRSLKPVDQYLQTLTAEVNAVRARLGDAPQMLRLHLGGGTPTLLSPDQMDMLLGTLDAAFSRAEGFEFSVEIDPTEADPRLLDRLARHGMKRASIGVQDFAPKVQDTIGRQQSVEQTQRVIEHLRSCGVQSLNIDLLYGLPHQTAGSLLDTLEQIMRLQPDRLALYGYAHVPHMSKRQAMIPSDDLPNAAQRFEAARIAKGFLLGQGYHALGIDHFARPSDSLHKAAQAGHLRRNFQGYTDDPCETLIGFGASAISRFKPGFLQNAVATAAYQARIRETGLAADKGYALSAEDRLVSEMIDQIMCEGRIAHGDLFRQHPGQGARIQASLNSLMRHFPKAIARTDDTVFIRPSMEPLARVLAAHLDKALQGHHQHSAAI